MKVWLGQSASEAAGGLYRVFQGLYTYLPKVGVEITPDKNQADVIHANIALFEDFPSQTPLVMSSHGLMWNDHEWGNLGQRVNKECLYAYRVADVVTAPSDFVARAIARHTLVKPKIVRHGINSSVWQPGINKGYVLWNKARVDAANDPKEVNKLANLALDVNFMTTFGKEANNVYVFGKVGANDMIEIVANAGIYFDSPKESGGPCFGVLEAMSCEVPVLAWNIGGNAEAIIHKETGYLAAPGNYEDLLDGLYYCINNRKRLGKAARQHVLDNYQWEKVILGYLDAYQTALERDRSSKVTVVVPCYNLGRFLPRCLDSVLEQDYPNWECIIVNDASSDNTAEIIREYEARDSRFRGIHNKTNLHVSESRNIGVKAGDGRYVLPLDADDRLFPDALTNLVYELDHHRYVSVVAGKLKVYHESALEGPGQDSGWPNGTQLNLQLQGYNRLPYCSMYRRRVWENLGGYRTRIRSGVEDADFWTRLLSYGYEAKLIDAYTLKYTYREQSLGKTNQRGAGAWLDWYPWREDIENSPAVNLDVPSYDPPTVSIVVPVGPGHEKYIQTCVDSVVAQSYDNWELVLVNDTGRLWENSLNIPAFVSIVDSDKNRGVAAARNAGVRRAKAKRIIFLDVDDIAQPHMVETLLVAHEYADGWIYGDWYSQTDEKLILSEAHDWSYKTIVNRSLGPITGIYWKKHIEQVGGFEEDAPGWEDWDFHLKLLQLGVCGTRVKTPLITYNMHYGQRREENFSDKDNLLEYILERHKNLREHEMGCNCGGKRSLTLKKTPKEKQDDTMNEIVTLQYHGPVTSHQRIKSKTVPGAQYRFSNKKPFQIFESDLELFLSKQDQHGNKFFTVIEPPKKTLPAVTEETALRSEMPRETKTSIEHLELDSKILGLIAKFTIEELHAIPDQTLLEIPGIGLARLQAIREALDKWLSD